MLEIYLYKWYNIIIYLCLMKGKDWLNEESKNENISG